MLYMYMSMRIKSERNIACSSVALCIDKQAGWEREGATSLKDSDLGSEWGDLA